MSQFDFDCLIFLLARGIEQPPQHLYLPHGPSPLFAARYLAIQFGIFGKERIRFGIELDGRKGEEKREVRTDGKGAQILAGDLKLQRSPYTCMLAMRVTKCT